MDDDEVDDVEISIVPVTPAEVLLQWEAIEPYLEQALIIAAGRYLPVDVLMMLLQGTAQMWFVTDKGSLIAILVTQINNWPRKRSLSFFLAAGSRTEEWLPIADTILTEYAKHMGCHQFEVIGRRGWSRVFGVDPHATLLIKEIT